MNTFNSTLVIRNLAQIAHWYLICVVISTRMLSRALISPVRLTPRINPRRYGSGLAARVLAHMLKLRYLIFGAGVGGVYTINKVVLAKYVMCIEI